LGKLFLDFSALSCRSPRLSPVSSAEMVRSRGERKIENFDVLGDPARVVERGMATTPVRYATVEQPVQGLAILLCDGQSRACRRSFRRPVDSGFRDNPCSEA
jgi:hypothetical protein